MGSVILLLQKIVVFVDVRSRWSHAAKRMSLNHELQGNMSDEFEAMESGVLFHVKLIFMETWMHATMLADERKDVPG